MNFYRIKYKICKMLGGHFWRYYKTTLHKVDFFRSCSVCGTVQQLTKLPGYNIKDLNELFWVDLISLTKKGVQKEKNRNPRFHE